MGNRPEYNGFCLWNLVGAFNGGDICPGSQGVGKVEQVREGLSRENSEHNGKEYCERALRCEGQRKWRVLWDQTEGVSIQSEWREIREENKLRLDSEEPSMAHLYFLTFIIKARSLNWRFFWVQVNGVHLPGEFVFNDSYSVDYLRVF